MIFDNRSQTAIQAQLIQSIQKKENRVGLSDNGSKPIQKITVVNVTDDFHLAFRHINTLAGLNEVLEAHLIPILTPHSIFYRLRYPGREPEGNNRYTREDGVVLDEYVQLRIGDLTNGGLIPFIDEAIEQMNRTIYSNQTLAPLLGGDAPVGLSEDGRLLPRHYLLGYIRASLCNLITQRPIQDVTVPEGNGYRLAANAADHFINVEGARLEQIVTALTRSTVNVNGVWNRVRTIHTPLYHAELKIGGIENVRVYAPIGSSLLSIVGAAMH